MDMTAWLVVTIISFIGCALYLRSRIGRVTLLDTIRAYQMPSIDHLDFPEPSTRTYMVHPAVHLRSSSWCMDRLRSGLETGIDLDHDLRRAAHDPNTDILQGLRMGPSEIRQRRSPERERPEREHPLDPGLGVRPVMGEIHLQDILDSVLVNHVNRILRLSRFDRFWAKHTLGHTVRTDIILDDGGKAGLEVKNPTLDDELLVAVWTSGRRRRFRLTEEVGCMRDVVGRVRARKVLEATRQAGRKRTGLIS